MFEQDRTTGQLSVTRDQLVAWLDIVDGKIVRARATDLDADSRAVVMHVLDWREGFFELAAGAHSGKVELDASVTHLLLEHARLRDEARQ
jgi:hypothetical protein